MSTTNVAACEVRRIQAEIMRQAARIAESEASPLAVEYWNRACQRIAQRLDARAITLEVEVAESPAIPGGVFPIRLPLPSPAS